MVYLSPNPEGGYAGSLEEDSYRVEINEIEGGILSVTIEPLTRGWHYVFAALLAVLVGVNQYRSSLQKEAKEEDDGFSPSSIHPPDVDPLYEEFLQGDANRRLFPRPHLEKEFEKWRAGRGTSNESEVS